MDNGKILICGAGVAGPTLAYWLRRHGFAPTVVERAPEPRAGGYIIDFWGLGFEVASRMGILPELRRAGYATDEFRTVNAHGRRVGGFSARVFQSTLGDRYLSLLRSDLAHALYGALGRETGSVEIRFGDTITDLVEHGNGVEVAFEHAPPARFDLVIGAGGLHSPVRQIVFGPEVRFEHYLGYATASFSAARYPHRDASAYVSYAAPGRQVTRYSLRGDRTIFFFVFRQPWDAARERNPERQKALLRAAFSGDGWEVPLMMERLSAATDFYYDAVSQIRMGKPDATVATEGMESWSRGRVGLVGDACSCPSLLAGQGSALAMAGAYILAGELKRADGDYRAAFSRYEKMLRPLIASKQRGAVQFAGAFAPKTRGGIWFRNQVTRFMTLPWVAHLAIGRMLDDGLELPDY